MSRIRLVAVAAVLSMLAVLSPGLAGGAGAAPGDAPTFIVTLRSGEPHQVAADHSRRYGADVEFVYEHALQGYAARVSEGQIGALARDRRVARVERDQVVHAVETQSNATWGLDRVDDRSGLDGTYTYDATGAGVHAYIIDTGILTTHDDFGGRAGHGYDAVSNDFDTTDCHGHGTHVAGTVGGSTWGVAKAATLVGVRVLDCNGSGTWAGVIAGIDWVTDAATDADGNLLHPAVANMSLGGGASDTVDAAVRTSIAAGVSYAIAAGNGNRAGREQDACDSSPARVAEAMTIGATNKSDAKTSWSNYGDCVDWFAPGYQITSAWYTSNTATNTISGTSMAAPHAAGAAALYLQGNTGASAQQVRDALYAQTTKGIVTSSKTTNNHLLYTLVDGGGGGGGDEPATAPAAPSDLAASATSSSTIDLTWADNSADETGFEIERSDGASFLVGAGVTAHTDSGLVADTTYSYRVRAVNDAGSSDWSNTATATTSADSSSTTIELSGSGYKVKGLQTVDLSWTNSTSVVVHRDGTAIATVSGSTYTDQIDARGGGSYTYTVCEAGTSTCSNAVTITF